MNVESLKKSISEYKQQLKQIDLALSSSEEADKNDLLSLKSDVEQLIELTEENLKHLSSNEQPSTSQTNNAIDDEYMLFMQEMAAEGVESNVKKKLEEEQRKDLEEDLKSLEGMKCQAPHKHSWGGVTYHNALVCGVVKTEDNQSFNDIQVRIFFTNPTHREMLPCPYFLEDSNCKFTEDKCRFSHGETVPFSSLKEYVEPNFEKLKPNCRVLAKNKDNLWHRAVVVKIGRSNCSIRYESSKKEESVDLKDILPLEDSEENDESSSSDSDSPAEEEVNDWAIQKSLLSLTPSQALGDWEKHTKGIGSKLMQQMGYIVGTGLGKNAEGRIDPVQAVILPSGKSLDHCMSLRDLAGGDKDLFSAERKLKKQQKQQEALSKKAYERDKNKKDVFQFLNETLTSSKSNESKSDVMNKEQIKTRTSRDLNVASLKLESDIKKVEQEIYKIKDNLSRLKPDTVMHKNLLQQLSKKNSELSSLKDTVRNITKEQNLRKDKMKSTVF